MAMPAMMLAVPSGSACWRRCHPPPSNMMDPGATELNRIFLEASWRAMFLAWLIMAAFTAL